MDIKMYLHVLGSFRKTVIGYAVREYCNSSGSEINIRSYTGLYNTIGQILYINTVYGLQKYETIPRTVRGFYEFH